MKKIILVLFVCFLGKQFMFAQTTSCPCCSVEHQAFDFWVGSWEVQNPEGNVVGTNTIEKIEGGCALQENWRNATGKVTGRSLNFYNGQTENWEQLWVDNSGSVLKLKGNRIKNQMILTSDPFKRADGKSYVNRITWTSNEDGTVRQLWEVLSGAKVITVAFDGLYKKTKE